jgi:hypothetical protein
MQITSRARQKARLARNPETTARLKNEKHFPNLLKGFSEAFVTGKFCDVKVVCQVRVGKLLMFERKKKC